MKLYWRIIWSIGLAALIYLMYSYKFNITSTVLTVMLYALVFVFVDGICEKINKS